MRQVTLTGGRNGSSITAAERVKCRVLRFPAEVERPTWPSICCVVARSPIFGVVLCIFLDHAALLETAQSYSKVYGSYFFVLLFRTTLFILFFGFQPNHLVEKHSEGPSFFFLRNTLRALVRLDLT